MRRRSLALAALFIVAVTASPASAHSGGLDSKGGHYCRQAGYNSGKCSPLNSYHYHSGGGGSGGGGGSSAPAAPPPPPG